jgi:hypothetical protein
MGIKVQRPKGAVQNWGGVLMEKIEKTYAAALLVLATMIYLSVVKLILIY